MNKLICQFTWPLLHRSFPNGSQTTYGSLARGKFKFNKVSRMSNPGINNRMKMIEENTPSYRETENLDLEDMESDFMKADKMYNSHKREIQNKKEKNQLQIVERKYFKMNVQPNFLTWSEKEQIRYLHDTDELEWSVEKLSASFPASENVIRKVIKSRWKPEDSTQIVRHDNSVHKNWQLLLKGELEIDPNLKTHLLQFGKREKVMPKVPNHSLEVLDHKVKIPKSKNSEFLNIIQSYEKSMTNNNITLETKTLTVSSKPSQDKPVENASHYSGMPLEDTYTLDGSKQNKTDPHFTLSQYRRTFNSPPHKEYIQTETILPKNTESLVVNKQENKHKQITPMKNYDAIAAKGFLPEKVNSENFMEKISIPKNKWKEGGTYKVGDCYYDDDGEFLYRVPGMN